MDILEQGVDKFLRLRRLRISLLEKANNVPAKQDPSLKELSEVRFFVGSNSIRGNGLLLKNISGIAKGLPEAVDLDPPMTIHNAPDMKPRELRAVFTFYSREEMLALVRFLLEEISAQCRLEMETMLKSFEDIGDLPLQEIEQYVETYDYRKMQAFAYLCRIAGGMAETGGEFHSLRELCGKAPMISMNPEEMRRYIPCCDEEGTSDPRAGKIADGYLAVKSVDYYVHFPWTNGKIAFSIGDWSTPNHIVEEEITRSVKTADALLLVKRWQQKSDFVYSEVFSLSRCEEEILPVMHRRFLRDHVNRVFYLFHNSRQRPDSYVNSAEAFLKTHYPEVKRGIVENFATPDETIDYFRKIVPEFLAELIRAEETAVRELEAQASSLR